MNGFEKHGLDEGAFEEKESFGALKTFDAFPKTKPTYTRRTTSGGYATILLIIVSVLLSLSEFRRWYAGSEAQQFSVEKGVSHTLQINLDTVVAMKCDDLHINVQDASGDRVFAGEILKREVTSWALWTKPAFVHVLGAAKDQAAREQKEHEDTHAGHVLGEVRKAKKAFPKTPRIRRGMSNDACRIYGTLEGNKVQGDFHITAKGHGYMDFGEHLDHQTFNFSHVISELSFGPLYPSLLNPLDNTVAPADDHFYRFQYYLSIVPTIYTRTLNPKHAVVGPQGTFKSSKDAILTNQYAVTSQSHAVPETTIPGIFFKFDIEPILLTISESRGSFLALCVRIVNVVSGILVGGGWMYQLWGWGQDVMALRGKGRSAMGEGMLHGRKDDLDDGSDD